MAHWQRLARRYDAQMPCPQAVEMFRRRRNRVSFSAQILTLALTFTGAVFNGGGCASSDGGNGATGGSSTGGATGGKATGGASSTGGASTGGASGGAPGSGGTATGGTGTATGGSGNATGGTGGATGGSHAGGASTGGAGGSGARGGAGGTATGGTATGGANAGGSTGGAAGGCLICEDFESSGTSLDAAKWVVDAAMGAAVGKADIVAGGAHGSGKAAKVSGGYAKFALKAGLWSGVSTTFYVRANMKFDMAQPGDHVTYLMFDDQTHQLRIGAQNGGMIWNYDSTDSILPDYNAAAMSLKPAPNEWHCFEFEIDAATPSLHAWMDGTESKEMLLDKTSTDGIDSRWMHDMPGWKPNITNFSFGSGYPNSGKVTLWIDDIAISNSPIGCKF